MSWLEAGASVNIRPFYRSQGHSQIRHFATPQSRLLSGNWTRGSFSAEKLVLLRSAREATRRILDHSNNQGELLAILGEMRRRQLKVINLQDKTIDGRSGPLSEIDPFTFLASFNRGVTDRNRRDNWSFLKEHWGLEASVPDDFAGIPTLHPMRSRLMPWEKDRHKDHVTLLWQVATQGADDGVERIQPDLFDRCVNLDLVGIASLTIGLFWMNPEKFLATDKKNVAYGRDKGVTTEPTDYRSYRQWLTEMTQECGNNYPQVSQKAHLFWTGTNGGHGGHTGLTSGGGDPPPPAAIAYWWLNANPKIWNFEDTPVGQRQSYTSHNEKGNKRQKYKHFQEVNPGDLVIGYVTSPQKEVVAVCEITKGLHPTKNGEEIEFEKVEQLAKPIAYETLQANPDLAKCEPLINNQGSLFKLAEQEYEIIRSLIDETNISVTTEIESYDKQKAMEGLFLAEAQFDEMLAALGEKKNVVLQGATGTTPKGNGDAGAPFLNPTEFMQG